MEWRSVPSITKDQDLYVNDDHTHTVWQVTNGCFASHRILDDKVIGAMYRSRKYTFSSLKQAKRWSERDWRNGDWLAARVMVDVAVVVDG
jgi:hypothetical protein